MPVAGKKCAQLPQAADGLVLIQVVKRDIMP